MTKTVYYIGFHDWWKKGAENLLFVSRGTAKETSKMLLFDDNWETEHPTFSLTSELFFSQANLEFLNTTMKPSALKIKKANLPFFYITSARLTNNIEEAINAFEEFYKAHLGDNHYPYDNLPYRIEQLNAYRKQLKENKELK